MSTLSRQEGLAVQHLRESVGWTQKEFVEKVFGESEPVSPKVLSSIERGHTRLDIQRRKKIEDHFGRSLDAATQEMDAAGTVRLMTDNDYFETLSEFLRSTSASHPAEIWFWHPSVKFPIIENKDENAREQWIANLSKDVAYNLVWPLPVCSRTDIIDYRNKALELLAEAKVHHPNMKGKIEFWGLGLKNNSLQEHKNSLYTKEAESYKAPTGINGLIFHELTYFETHPDLYDVLTYSGLVLALGTNGSYGASFHESRKSLDADSKRVEGWLNLWRTTLAKLEHLAGLMRSLTPEKSGDT